MNTKAMIYTRGHNEESIARQIARCEYFAELAGYEVIGYINGDDIHNEIWNADVLIVSDASRLSRKAEEFYSIRKSLADDGIRLEIADRDNARDIVALHFLEMMRTRV